MAGSPGCFKMTLVSSRWSVQLFLRRLASSDPAPGGGSAAALAGALGCALGAMVARILLSRPKIHPAQRRALDQSRRRLDRSAAQFLRLMEKDARVYQRLIWAQKSGRGVKKARAEGIRIPLRMCEESGMGLKLLQGLLRRSGPDLGSDLKAGMALLRGASQAAVAMVEVNRR